MNKFLMDEDGHLTRNSDYEKEKCEYCTGKPLVDRKPLMISFTSDYNVFINSCNHLEDSVIGNSIPYSLHGVKINFCPMCGRELGKFS